MAKSAVIIQLGPMSSKRLRLDALEKLRAEQPVDLHVPESKLTVSFAPSVLDGPSDFGEVTASSDPEAFGPIQAMLLRPDYVANCPVRRELPILFLPASPEDKKERRPIPRVATINQYEVFFSHCEDLQEIEVTLIVRIETKWSGLPHRLANQKQTEVRPVAARKSRSRMILGAAAAILLAAITIPRLVAPDSDERVMDRTIPMSVLIGADLKGVIGIVENGLNSLGRMALEPVRTTWLSAQHVQPTDRGKSSGISFRAKDASEAVMQDGSEFSGSISSNSPFDVGVGKPSGFSFLDPIIVEGAKVWWTQTESNDPIVFGSRFPARTIAISAAAADATLAERKLRVGLR